MLLLFSRIAQQFMFTSLSALVFMRVLPSFLIELSFLSCYYVYSQYLFYLVGFLLVRLVLLFLRRFWFARSLAKRSDHLPPLCFVLYLIHFTHFAHKLIFMIMYKYVVNERVSVSTSHQPCSFHLVRMVRMRCAFFLNLWLCVLYISFLFCASLAPSHLRAPHCSVLVFK